MGALSLSALLAAILSFAIGVSVILREHKRGAFLHFTILCFVLGFWHLSTLVHTTLVDASPRGAATADWMSLLFATFIPVASLRFFETFLAEDPRHPPPTSRWLLFGAAATCALLGYGVVLQPIHRSRAFDAAFAAFVFAGLGQSVHHVWVRYRAAPNRSEAMRILYLFVGATTSLMLAMTAYLPRLGDALPAAGNVLTIIYLYFLSQTLFRYRLLDLNELLGKMVVLSVMVLILAGLYGLLLFWVERGGAAFFFNTVIASFVILVLFEPMRSVVEDAVNRWMFREKYELRRRMEQLRRELAAVIDPADLVRRVLRHLEESQRVTHAAVYLLDRDGTGYEMAGCVGPAPEPRIDVVTRRPFFDRLRKDGVLMVETLERLQAGLPGEEAAAEIVEVVRAMEEMRSSLCLPLSAGRDTLGLLSLRDERLRDAFSTDDIDLFRGVAAQMSITLMNSHAYEQMKERARLAALGEMAAGLAHEIRNPLGAIKGAAQYLLPQKGVEPPAPALLDAPPPQTREFLDIIVEEVNRLNRVVSQFLDYARPDRGEREVLDVNEIVRRTAQLLDQEGGGDGKPRVEIQLQLGDGLPPVRAHAEQLRQVFLNLGLNAIQAMPDGGKLVIATRLRRGARRGEPASFLEVRFRDNGPGIPPNVMKNLFVPFYTTKDKGTGLGLAISQRIAENHGGAIEVRSRPGSGATFAVLLPLGEETATRTAPPASVTPHEAA